MNSVFAEQVDSDAHAKYNFQLFCQGCHTADGSGNKSVPSLKKSMARFLRSQVGREYLVRVPGSANSALDNENLAEVLNWMLVQFSSELLETDWQQYSAEEVARYRQQPLFETIEYRKKILQSLPDH